MRWQREEPTESTSFVVVGVCTTCVYWPSLKRYLLHKARIGARVQSYMIGGCSSETCIEWISSGQRKTLKVGFLLQHVIAVKSIAVVSDKSINVIFYCSYELCEQLRRSLLMNLLSCEMEMSAEFDRNLFTLIERSFLHFIKMKFRHRHFRVKSEIDLIPESAFPIKRHQPASYCEKERSEMRKKTSIWLIECVITNEGTTIGILTLFSASIVFNNRLMVWEFLSSRRRSTRKIKRRKLRLHVSIFNGERKGWWVTTSLLQTIENLREFLKSLVIGNIDT